MDTQGSSTSKPMAEVHIDVTPDILLDQHTKTDEASQDSRRPNLYEVSLRIESSQGNRTPTEGSQVQLKVEVNGNYRQLFEAAVKGDWKAAEKILDKDIEAMFAKFMTVQKKGYGVLEVAVVAAQDQFVENLVKRLPLEHDVKDALTYAAQEGRIRMVKALVKKDGATHTDVLSIASHSPMQKEVISYLARRTSSAPSCDTMKRLVSAGHLDICVYLARRHPVILTSNDEENRILFKRLAKMKSHFRSGEKLNFWEKSIYKCIPLCLINTWVDNSKHKMIALPAIMRFKISLWNIATKLGPFIKRIGELKLKHKYSLEFANLTLPEKETDDKSPKILEFISGIVLEAASLGISEIVKLCLKNFPELMWDRDFTKKLVKKIVEGRQVELFRLVNGHLSEGFLTKQDLKAHLIDWSPICESRDVSGAAFFLQRELQWFEVVKSKTAPTIKNQSKSRETFVQNRKGLLKEAGQWMKDTSSSCSVVATLIITVTFAAAFTVPGGNDSNTGIPIFLKKRSFTVFAIADSFALSSSVAATLMFLTILTSRYAIEDFLRSLPRNMIIGLTFLNLSLASMLVAFGSALTIVLSERLKWIFIPFSCLAAFTVVMFAILQLPLYFEMAESTFRPRLYRPLKLWK